MYGSLEVPPAHRHTASMMKNSIARAMTAMIAMNQTSWYTGDDRAAGGSVVTVLAAT